MTIIKYVIWSIINIYIKIMLHQFWKALTKTSGVVNNIVIHFCKFLSILGILTCCIKSKYFLWDINYLLVLCVNVVYVCTNFVCTCTCICKVSFRQRKVEVFLCLLCKKHTADRVISGLYWQLISSIPPPDAPHTHTHTPTSTLT